MTVKSEPQSGVRGWIKRHPVASFFVLAYAITWLAWLPDILGYRGDLGQVLTMIAQFGPALAALVLARYSGASVRTWLRSIVRWRVAPRWYVVAVGLPVMLIFVQGALFGLLDYPLDISSIPGQLVNFLPSVIILALIAGLGEEPGWRGFVLPRLEARYAPVLATVVLGFVWAMWHLPLVFVDPRFPHGFTSVAPQILLALLTMLTIFFYAFFYTWVYNRTQSVLLCMLLHGSFNAAIGLLPASLEVLQRGTYVALLVIQGVSLLFAVAVLVVGTSGRLGYTAAPERAPADMEERRVRKEVHDARAS
jgi:membrane protease YdiL (CAAX protease family)